MLMFKIYQFTFTWNLEVLSTCIMRGNVTIHIDANPEVERNRRKLTGAGAGPVVVTDGDVVVVAVVKRPILPGPARPGPLIKCTVYRFNVNTIRQTLACCTPNFCSFSSLRYVFTLLLLIFIRLGIQISFIISNL
ncbi:hypothetical protein L1987_75821 [Smallanthus sonchifolius]|uniref:Uncharacterized protein n=1 Tax=Smallanthus sonchifolius TaxID=185202 RepID=A0ACB9A6V2_9ASTR|nr:hypothetical protein L1987_75821 [Smallanthus sonchifolius]